MKDLFSGHAASYAKYRPAYPQELFDFIFSQVENKQVAWDCATGNGQTAQFLAPHFKTVFATDISREQIHNAIEKPNIHYSVQPAEQTNFSDNSFDLVTVSQALHWLNFDLFYKELNRVIKQGGWFAAWMYGGLKITPEIDALKCHHHDVTLGPYWDSGRKFINENYQNIPFPFKEISCPIFHMNYMWGLDDLKGYFNTWSALQRFIEIHEYNPVDKLMSKIQRHWITEKMNVGFPIYMRMAKIEK